MNKVFFSYSKHDRDMLEQLQHHLSLLKNQGKIEPWDDHDILPGEEWDAQIRGRLANANIILLLVSSDFIATDYIWKVEIKEAMARHERGESVVIPIILRPCDWEEAPFGKLNGLPSKGKAISSFHNPDEAWLQVVKGIKRVIDSSPGIGETRNKLLAKPEITSGKGVGRNYNVANLYKLIDTAFNDEGLQIFCMLHFEKVYNNFAAGQSKAQRVTALIDHAKRYVEVEKLLALLQQENPTQHKQFKPYY